ncbi:DUF2079 domain-containing protein, partial [Patescibacteria group bacterium]
FTFFVFVIYALIASLVSLYRYWQYEAFYYDFGIYDQAIWQISRFQMPIIDHLALGRIPIFADHFIPSTFLLAPIYWITTRSEVLLIIQALAVSTSGLVLYQIGKKLIKNRWLSFVIMVSYFLYIGLQNAIITNFHPVTVANLFIMLTFWAIVSKKVRLFWLFLLIMLGFKESMFSVGIGIGIFLVLVKPVSNHQIPKINTNWKVIGFWTILTSLSWGILVTRVIIPYFSKGIYLYAPIFPSETSQFFSRFIDQPEKIKTIWYSLRSFFFLPIFSPILWPLVIQDLFIRFIPLQTDGRWNLGMHYSASLSAILAIASLWGMTTFKNTISKHKSLLKYLKNYKKYQKTVIFIIGFAIAFNSLFLHQFVLHGPLGLAYNKAFYQHSKSFEFLNDMVSKVPQNASVMTQNHLAVRFTHQPLFLTDIEYEKYEPDFIVLDLRTDQNPNNIFGHHGKNFSNFVQKLSTDPRYTLIYNKNDQNIYKLK